MGTCTHSPHLFWYSIPTLTLLNPVNPTGPNRNSKTTKTHLNLTKCTTCQHCHAMRRQQCISLHQPGLTGCKMPLLIAWQHYSTVCPYSIQSSSFLACTTRSA